MGRQLGRGSGSPERDAALQKEAPSRQTLIPTRKLLSSGGLVTRVDLRSQNTLANEIGRASCRERV